MKRSEKKSGGEDAARRTAEGRVRRTLTPETDRLSRSLPDAKRLSAVCRAALARGGSRWLAFARTLSRLRGPLPGTGTLAFIESLYGGRFGTTERAAFTGEKVYRKVGGGVFVSETRLGVSMRPGFELRVVSAADSRLVSHTTREVLRTKTLHLPPPGRVRTNEPPRAAPSVSNLHPLVVQAGTAGSYQTVSRTFVAATPQRLRHHDGARTILLYQAAPGSGGARESATTHTWNVMPAGAGRLLTTFSYVAARGPRFQQASEGEPARRFVGGDGAMSASAEARPSSQAEVRHGRQPARLDLRQSQLRPPRTEFLKVLLKPSDSRVEYRNIQNLNVGREISGRHPAVAFSHAAAGMPLTPASRAPELRLLRRTETGLTTRQSWPAGAELRREFSSPQADGEYRTAQAAVWHGAEPGLLQLGQYTTWPASFHGTAAGEAAKGVAFITYQPGVRPPALILQRLRVQSAPQGAGPGLRTVYTSAPRTRSPLVNSQPGAGITHAFVTHAARPAVYERPGSVLELIQRRDLRRESPGHGGASGGPASGLATSQGHFQFAGAAAEGVRAAQAAAFVSSRPAVRSAHVKATKGRGPSAEAAAAQSARETRAARPEGMALELVRQRREEVLRLPPLGYVFTQPARQPLQEQQVVSRTSREEVVEVVRREVRALTASGPASAPASRADFAGLADEVYSTLVRRLLVEKERLGLS